MKNYKFNLVPYGSYFIHDDGPIGRMLISCSIVFQLDMPKEHITANVAEIIKDVCTQRPVSFGE